MQSALTVGSFVIEECMACGHRATELPDGSNHVARVYGDDYFNSGGAGYPDYPAEERILIRRGHRYAQLVSRFASARGRVRVLDVGAAAGFTLRAFEEQGWTAVGLEPNDSMASLARESGLDVRTTTLEAFRADADFDLVCCLQVLEHLIEPALALERITGLLAPGGLVLIETWDWQSRPARWLGKAWHQYSPPSVLHWYSEESLRRLMASHGLRKVATGRTFKQISWNHARSLISHKLGRASPRRIFDGLARLLPGRLVLPYPLNDARWFLFRSRPGSVR